VDRDKDKEGLKQARFMQKLKVEKFKEMVKTGQSPASADQVTIDAGEYQKYLKMAYRDEKFPKPRDLLGFAKNLPAPEMEKLMLTHIVVTDDDLRALAAERAEHVKNTLVKSGRVGPERIFIVEPKSLSPEKQGSLKESRVDFKLK
jgi:hypothetical protein